jgi:hypothetical protein
MTQRNEFESEWLARFGLSLMNNAGKEVSERVMEGCDKLFRGPRQEDTHSWTAGAMSRLDALVDENTRNRVMAACACRYPETGLKDIREAYRKTGDIDLVHGKLQAKFLSFLRDSLGLNEKIICEVVNRGWGLAGVKSGGALICTKIPKGAHLTEYINEKDEEKKKKIYCHCPRIREAIRSKASISPTYCYCGAGFYKGIWEYILQKPVRVQVLESILKGNDVCKIAVYLP